jgi:hypothetical protein
LHVGDQRSGAVSAVMRARRITILPIPARWPPMMLPSDHERNVAA